MYSNKLDPIRINSVNKLQEILKNEIVSRKIEKDIYNYCIQISKQKYIKRNWDNVIFKNLYMNKVVSIYSNLDSNTYIQNKNFLQKILSGDIDCSNISKLHMSDIFPEAWKELLNKKAKTDKVKFEKKQVAMTSLFTCRKCGSKECSYYEVQTRSADEPMTQFVTCLSCNKRWKE